MIKETHIKEMNISEAAKIYADRLYEPSDRGILYNETQKDFIAGAEWQKKQSYTEDQIKQAILDYCDENGMDDEEAKECVDDFINNFLNKNV